MTYFQGPLWVLKPEVIIVASDACSRVGKSFVDATSAGLKQLKDDQHRDKAAGASSRVGNFLAVGLPHLIASFHNVSSPLILSPMSREMALVAYRNLLRSARIAFQGLSPMPLMAICRKLTPA